MVGHWKVGLTWSKNMRYEAGDTAKPRGHAIVYFTTARTGQILASYVVALPVTLDLSRYVPPMLAGRMPAGQGAMSGAIPVPPIPEAVESIDALRRLAALRDDDLIDGGELSGDSPEQLMASTALAAQRYGEAYGRYEATVPAAPSPKRAEPAMDDPYADMGEADRVKELVKLVGVMRYAQEGKDERGLREAARHIKALGAGLPPKYRVDELLEAVSGTESASNDLIQLLIERCFLLLNEEYERLPDVESRIRALRAP